MLARSTTVVMSPIPCNGLAPSGSDSPSEVRSSRVPSTGSTGDLTNRVSAPYRTLIRKQANQMARLF